MKKEYYDEQKAAYIQKVLETTNIDKVWYPLVSDIFLRRQFEFKLDDNQFNRDVRNFIKNVDAIEVGDIPGNNAGMYNIPVNKIVLDRKAFKNKFFTQEAIYETVAHEVMHAINYEKTTNPNEPEYFKWDRTFPGAERMGIMEIFNECKADAIAFNNSDKSKYFELNQITTPFTNGYTSITPYIDVMASSIGVSRRDLLIASERGRDNLEILFGNDALNSYEVALEKLYEQSYSGISENSKENAEKFFAGFQGRKQINELANTLINRRIKNLNTENIYEFNDQFERLKLDKKMIDITQDYVESLTNIPEQETDLSKIINIKLTSINQVLNNSEIENSKKLEIIASLKNMEKTREITQYKDEQGIEIYYDRLWNISKDTIKRFADERTTDIEWDNSEILNYIKENKKELSKDDRVGFIKNILDKVFKKFKSIREGREQLQLPEGKQRENDTPVAHIEKEVVVEQPERTNPWDLTNWGIDKERFNIETQKRVEEHIKDLEERKENQDRSSIKQNDGFDR